MPRQALPRARADFTWTDGCVEVVKTGVRLPVDRHLLAEVASWVLWFAVMTPIALAARLRRGRKAVRLYFTPDTPRPWYMIRAICLFAGIGVARSPDEATAAIYFDDVTAATPPDLPPGVQSFNFRCADVSKGRVAALFEEVFGYPLARDPRLTIGDLVEKPEKNGVHGGRIVRGPLHPHPGQVYQRLVDTTDKDGQARDLRTVCIGGAPVLVWIKTKPASRRFAIQNRSAVLAEPAEVFSPQELSLIREFNNRIGLDLGGLDILRERRDGRIYIVDANKTDVGPVIALSRRDKLDSLRRLALAFDELLRRDRANSEGARHAA